MRKLLCGVAVGFLVLAGASVAGAQEEGDHGGGTLSHADAAHEIKEIGEEAGLDHVVIECIELAAEHNDEERCVESPSPIMPAWNELLYGGLAFLVLLIALWKFGLPVATRMANERTEKIRNSLDEAESARAEAVSVRDEYQRQLADARAESTRIIEDARLQAEQVRRDLVARAEAEAAELRQRNADQVAAERDRVMGEVQGQVATLAIELAEKVVESNLDREANTRLIESYIASVGSRA